jgi:MOSC domain-containing protein YiiM
MAFQQPALQRRMKMDVKRESKMKLHGSFLPLWLQDRLSNENPMQEQQEGTDKATNQVKATVIRLAARKYNKEASKPSSRDYTTRKDSLATIKITTEGIEGDYNHYRTVALESTPDRAISLLTKDVMMALQSSNQFASCRDGDLGENVLLEGVAFHDVKVGQQYQFGCSNGVIIQVTEPMIPCANLCKLPYINDEKLAPKERIARCQALLEFLDEPGEGFRGWYAKVIAPGNIYIGDEFRAMPN